jgi:hypothetical protein
MLQSSRQDERFIRQMSRLFRLPKCPLRFRIHDKRADPRVMPDMEEHRRIRELVASDINPGSCN